MEKTNAIKDKRGMTLVEIILVLGIFSLIVLTISSIFVVGTRNQIETLLMKEIQENSRYLMELITREIRTGYGFPIDPGEYDAISFANQERIPITYKFGGGSLLKNGISITPPGITITGKFILKKYGPDYIPDEEKIPRITVVMKIEAERAGHKVKTDFQNTIFPRFFLKFDDVRFGSQNTDSLSDKVFPQFQVVGDQVVGEKIYYVWSEKKEGDEEYYQIWTGILDGTKFEATKRTESLYDKKNPQLQVFGNEIYYVWQGKDEKGHYQIWTAETGLDGTGFKETATKRTSTPFHKVHPQLEIAGDKIYYTWSELDGLYYQIWTAEMNKNGNNFENITQRTNTPFDKYYPQFQVVESKGKIFYVWQEEDHKESDQGHYQIWTAEMELGNTGYFTTATQRTRRTTSDSDKEHHFDKEHPQLQVFENKIYYVWQVDVWQEDGDAHYQIWTAEMNLDGIDDFNPIKRTNTSSTKIFPQLEVRDKKIYYTWSESDVVTPPGLPKYQIWTAEMGLDGTDFKTTKRTKISYNKFHTQMQIVNEKIYYVWQEEVVWQEEDDKRFYQIWRGSSDLLDDEVQDDRVPLRVIY